MVELFTNSILGYLIIVVLLGIVISGLYAVLKLKIQPEPAYHYASVEAVLDKWEKEFYFVLKNTLDKRGYEIFPKIRMADFLKVKNVKDNSLWWKEQNKILRKHVDFLICDDKNFLPLLVIELDGYSHSKKENAHRDKFKNEALEIAGVPLLRVTIQNVYNSNQLLQQIMNAMH